MEPDTTGHAVIMLDASGLAALPCVLSSRLPETGTWMAGWRRSTDDTRPALVEDSRKALPGDLFVAIRGTAFDGHTLIAELAAKGVYTAGEPGSGATLEVRDSRLFLAEAAEALEGHASRDLSLIGITGTNGKTTTAWLLHRVLSAQDPHAGHSGTLGTWIGPEARLDPGLTTPGATGISSLASDVHHAGGRHLVMEVSSHAVDQRRIAGSCFRTGIFLNLSPEHLDYHRTMEEYYRCKADFMKRADLQHRIVITDDPWGRKLAAELGAGCVTAGSGDGAQWRLVERTPVGSAQRLVIQGPDGTREEYTIPLPGAHNAQNALAALVALRVTGMGAAALAALCPRMSSAPGRLELLEKPGRARVVIDYAHTPDGYAKCFNALAELQPHAIHTVFGCGGERDRMKRPVMAGLAEHYSDTVIVTTDNPRREDPAQITEDIEAGLEQPEMALWIPDRAEAIRQALALAEADDLVLLLGKGHERYQIIATGKLPFDERAVVREAWNE